MGRSKGTRESAAFVPNGTNVVARSSLNWKVAASPL